MIISLSGTQGSGKTTLINILSSMGYNIIERKTSRSILEDWNITLDSIYSDKNLMKKFQKEIINRKYNDEIQYYDCKDLWFTDRSYIDLLIYSTIILGHDNSNSQWIDSYFSQCIKYQKKYHKVLYINPLPFITDDNIRPTNVVYNMLVDYSIKGYLYRFNKHNIIEIDTFSTEERIQQILQNL